MFRSLVVIEFFFLVNFNLELYRKGILDIVFFGFVGGVFRKGSGVVESIIYEDVNLESCSNVRVFGWCAVY